MIGSRWVPGGSVVNWPWHRQALSRGGNLYVRLLLGMSVRDATAGFRVFRRTTLEKIDLSTVASTGYVFQTDLAARTLRAGLRVREVPIEFVERVRGDSKMSGSVASESLRRVTEWGLRERRRQLTEAVRRRRAPPPGRAARAARAAGRATREPARRRAPPGGRPGGPAAGRRRPGRCCSWSPSW